MKKNLLITSSIILISVSAITYKQIYPKNTSDVIAKEITSNDRKTGVYFTNNNNIEMTKEQYNLLLERGVGKEWIENMNQYYFEYFTSPNFKNLKPCTDEDGNTFYGQGCNY